MRILVLVALAAAVLLAPLAARADDETVLQDRWYVLMMQGKRAGWMHTLTVRDCTEITSTSEMSISMKRGALEIEVSMKSVFAESHDGKPLWMETTQKLGATPTTTRYTFGEKEVAVQTSQGDGKPSTSTQPLPEGEWLTPHAAEELVRARLAAGDQEITVRSIDPATGLKPTTTTRRVKARVPVETLGKTVPGVKWDVENDYLPGATVAEFVDEQGVTLKSTTNMGGISIETLLADKDLATSKTDPPEILVSTLVEPDEPIDEPRGTTKAVYILSIPDGRMPELPSAGAQRAIRLDDLSFRITIDTASPRAAEPGEKDDASFTKPSGMLGSDDPEVIRLAEKAVARLEPGASPAKRAEALRASVHRHISRKNLGVGFATAAEVARTKTGDCSEHGTLLAAMLRAQGIPSRVVSGLIYADNFEGRENIFGYHMWAQALLDVNGRMCWVDLDATLPGERATDATHIALATSALQDGHTENAMVALAPLLGRLEIKVDKVE